jgi:hypothetical protein
MGWSIGYDTNWGRDIGYGVPATCDHPDCNKKIDRGLAHVCGGEPYGGEDGCGLYFCGSHLLAMHQQCQRCASGKKPFLAKPDHPEWIKWKLTHESWQEWRDENSAEVIKLQQQLEAIRAAAALADAGGRDE